MSSDNEDLDSPGSLQDDLFGSDDDVPAQKVRELSDEDLDLGDDEGRRDRAPIEHTEEDETEGREARVAGIEVARLSKPNPYDGEYHTLRMPNFLGIDPVPYDPETFEIPTTDHRSETQSKNFSASATSATTMRFRKTQNSGQFESNTVVYRWSDGSSTVAIGGDHYELQDKPLAPPKTKAYQPLQDSHTYLVSPSLTSSLLVTIGHMTNQYTVRPNKGVVDEALEKLQLGLAAASRRNRGGEDNGPELINTTIDPELQKKQAELAEKERIKAQRRRELAAEKASAPRGYNARGGLSVMDLEGRPGRRAPPGNKRARPTGRKQVSGYGSDDSDRVGVNYGDSYQDEDGFLAPSDEEEEEVEDDEEEEEFYESDREAPKSKKAKVSRDEGSDADADADLDDDEIPAPTASSEPAARGRNRHIIDDDDDDE